MQFPAFCIDNSTQGLIRVKRQQDFAGNLMTYVRPVELESSESILSLNSEHDQFMALKSKGWPNLNKAERALFQELKLKEAQLIEPLQ